MIILDTNVLSELMRIKPEPAVLAWVNAQPSASVWTTAVSIFEIQFGLEIMPSGRKRQTLKEEFAAVLHHDLGDRVLDFNSVAEHAAIIAGRVQAFGRPIELTDAMIAGIVVSQHATLATHNIKHFDDTGISVVNPWQP